jgi:hypothetical protein
MLLSSIHAVLRSNGYLGEIIQNISIVWHMQRENDEGGRRQY